jgi:hypothetical protein
MLHLAADHEIEPGSDNIIGVKDDLLVDLSAAEAIRSDRYSDLALAPGRDLSLAGDRRAPSAGFDPLDYQGRCSVIVDTESVFNHSAIEDRFEFEASLGHPGSRPVGPDELSESNQGANCTSHHQCPDGR